MPSVSSQVLILLAAALLLLALGLGLWGAMRQRGEARRAASFLDERLAAVRHGAAESSPVAATLPGETLPNGARQISLSARGAGPWSRLLHRAGLRPGLRHGLLVLAPAPLLGLFVGLKSNPAVGLLGLAIGVALTALVLGLRMQRQTQAMTHALPPFIDTMVRLLAVGQSIPAAFLSAIATTRGPLRTCFEAVGQRVRAGADLDRALEQAGTVYGFPPLLLFGAVVRMSIQYGGRVDQVLERVAVFMRDREQAQQELVALSAETRMSAWILALLPAGVGLSILFFNAAYLSGMWVDPTGQMLLIAAFALQLLGSYLMYRLARLR